MKPAIVVGSFVGAAALGAVVGFLVYVRCVLDAVEAAEQEMGS